MSLYAIFAHSDNAYDVAGFEDISLKSAENLINTAHRDHPILEPVYIVFGVADVDGFETPVYMTEDELNEKYTYNADLIKHTITKLVHK